MINKKKDLREGNVLWLSYPAPRIHHEELTGNKKADVVIIGAGVTGAMAAEELAAAGYSVIILDRRGPLKGSTAATTALLQYEIDTPLIELQKMIGKENAMRAWRRSKLGLDSLGAKIKTLKIDCELKEKSSIYLAGNALNEEELKKECEERNNIGIFSEYLTRNVLQDEFGLHKSAGIRSFDNLSANPRQMAAGFLLAAIKNGAEIYSPVKVTEVEINKNDISVMTDSGFAIKAKYVVYATGYEIPEIVKSKKHKVNSTWAIATKPQKKKLWKDECFFWEASEPYLYMRTTPDGRVICGGEDEEFVSEDERNYLLEKKTATLEKKLKALFPQLDTKAEFAWTGSFGSSTTGLPSIGKIPGMKNCFAIMAFGGNGIVYARIAAEVITALIKGRKDPEEDLFKLQ